LNDGLILSGLYIQEENFQNAFQVLSELYQNYPEDYQLVRTLILLLTKMNRNFDTIETIAKKFLKTSQNQEEKENIIKILPEEIRIKLINENNKKNDSQK
jgi:signal recognition particle GTPase